MAILISMLLILIIAVVLFSYYSEKTKWNGGICIKNNIKWEYFDTDSQGGRGYKAGDEFCWISWGLDKPVHKQ